MHRMRKAILMNCLMIFGMRWRGTRGMVKIVKKCGMEVDINAGGIDIPDQALATVANKVDKIANNGIADDDDMQTWFHKVEKFRSYEENIPKTSQRIKTLPSP